MPKLTENKKPVTTFQTSSISLTSVIASDDIIVDSSVDIGVKIVSGLDDKKLGEISLNRKNQAKTFATMRKSKTLHINDICCAR